MCIINQDLKTTSIENVYVFVYLQYTTRICKKYIIFLELRYCKLNHNLQSITIKQPYYNYIL